MSGAASRRSRCGSSPPATAASSRLLDCEDELLAVAGAVEIAHFLEATSATSRGPYDLSLVEGSITTPHDAERIREVRRASRVLVTIGACATAGGIQALRNFADVERVPSVVYAGRTTSRRWRRRRRSPPTSPVDFELRGCPIDKRQLLEVITAFLPAAGRTIPSHSVCVECKRRGTVCVMVAHGTPCLGPGDARRLRRALPGVRPRLLRLLRPDGDAEHGRRSRGGCAALGMRERDVERVFRTFNADAEPFRARARRHELSDAHDPHRLPRPGRGRGRDAVRARDGRVEHVELRIYEPPRFFEAFLRGRALHRAARHHRAHLRHLPGRLPDERVQAIEDALRRRGRRSRSATLRRLLYCGEWIESHALHIYLLHAPDFLGYDERDRAWRATTGRSSSAASR